MILPAEKEFSKNALNYDEYNIIQKEVAKKVISLVDNNPKRILDLGSGSGEIYKLINWNIKEFTAVDISCEMCKLHPKSPEINIINANYEDNELFKKLKQKKFDVVISSSSLQWCSNLNDIVKKISMLSDDCAVSIFCDKTFKTIYELSSLEPFLPSSDKVLDIFKKYFKVNYGIENYKLFFSDNMSKFRYIKKSGVSGGKKKLSFKQTKDLIKNYPLDYLEFEVVFIRGRKTFTNMI